MFPSILSILFISSCVFGVFLSSRAASLLRDFLDRHSAIVNEATLNDYKILARSQMKLALSLFGALGLAIVAMGILVIVKGDSAFLSLPLLGLVFGFAKRASQLENRVKSLDCANPTLERQYQQINRSWKEKAFPDF